MYWPFPCTFFCFSHASPAPASVRWMCSLYMQHYEDSYFCWANSEKRTLLEDKPRYVCLTNADRHHPWHTHTILRQIEAKQTQIRPSSRMLDFGHLAWYSIRRGMSNLRSKLLKRYMVAFWIVYSLCMPKLHMFPLLYTSKQNWESKFILKRLKWMSKQAQLEIGCSKYPESLGQLPSIPSEDFFHTGGVYVELWIFSSPFRRCQGWHSADGERVILFGRFLALKSSFKYVILGVFISRF
jgi:hypothetical protein